MVRLEMGFKPGWFERNLIRQTKNDIFRRLKGHDVGFLRIVLKKRDGRVAFQFFGDRAASKRLRAFSRFVETLAGQNPSAS